MAGGKRTPVDSPSSSSFVRRKSTPIDKRNRQVVEVVWKATRTLWLQFLPHVHFSKWQAGVDKEWATRVGLLNLYKSEHRSICKEFIYNFVEEYDR